MAYNVPVLDWFMTMDAICFKTFTPFKKITGLYQFFEISGLKDSQLSKYFSSPLLIQIPWGQQPNFFTKSHPIRKKI
jgi:hypothetical protein